MSDDESPRGGQQPTTNQENDSNSSIIEKVKVRVSNIIPETFTKWFSPTRNSNDSSLNRNGSLRRRRNDNSENDSFVEGNTEDDSDSEAEEPEARRPPAKKSRLNVTEEHTTSIYTSAARTPGITNFLSSTPTTVSRKRHLNVSRTGLSDQGASCSFSSPRSGLSSTLAETSAIPRYDFVSHRDALAVIPEGDTHISVLSRNTSSRRSLNIPSTSSGTNRRLPNLCRQSLKNARGTVLQELRAAETHDTLSNFRNAEQNAIEVEDEEGDDDDVEAVEINQQLEVVDSRASAKPNSEKITMTNGIRSSPNVLAVDTGSESGDSQCSSLQVRRATGLFGIGSKRLRSSIGSGLNFATHLQGEKSLFSDKNMPNTLNNSTTSLTSLNRRQSFNASLYGSTSALSDSRLLNTSSPFYDGRTTYGGASAYRKYGQQNRRAMHAPTLIRPSSSLSALSTSSSSAALSNTAKRILDLINQCTTPVGDAKKMGNNINKGPFTISQLGRNTLDGTHDSSQNRSVRITVSSIPYSRPRAGPPTGELQVPSMSQLLQMKKLQNNTERVREIASTSKSLLNREEYKLPTEEQAEQGPSGKHVNKVRNKKTSVRASAKNTAIDDQETIAPANLPNVALPLMKSVPKIDIALPTATINSASSRKASGSSSAGGELLSPLTRKPIAFATKSATTNKSNEPSSSHHQNYATQPSFSSSNNKTNYQHSPTSHNSPKSSTFSSTQFKSTNGVEFKFSSPMPVVTSKAVGSQVEPINHFKFREPMVVNNSTVATSSLSSSGMKFSYESAAQPKIEKIAANVRPPVPQLKSGSVLDALKKPISITSGTAAGSSSQQILATQPSSSFGDQFKMSSDKWECSVCMIRNDQNREKCAACETPRKKPETAAKPSTTDTQPLSIVSNSFGDKFKPSADTWECSVCMIRNKKDLAKCASCETPKSGAGVGSTATSGFSLSSSTSLGSSSSGSGLSQSNKSSIAQLKTVADTGFKKIVAQQNVQWECSACMTRNEKSRTKCICCEQLKPGAESENVPQFSFGGGATSSTSKFSFGFGAQKEDELKKATSSEATTVKKPDTTTEAKLTGSFSFGFKPLLTTTTATGSTATPEKPTFSFGIPPAATSTNPASGEKSDAEKNLSSTSIKFGVPADCKKPDDTTKPAAGTGGFAFLAPSPSTKSDQQSKTESSNFPFIAPAAPLTAASTASPQQEKNLDAAQKQPPTAAGNLFKPIGEFAFGAKDSTANLTNAAAAVTKTESPSGLTFGAPGNAVKTGPTTATASPSTAWKSPAGSPAKPLFAFGSPSTTAAVKPAEKKPEFAFGSPSSSAAAATGGFTGLASNSPSTAPPYKPPQITNVAATASAPTFVFGKPATMVSATPTFGATSSNANSTSTVTSSSTTAVPTFGSLAASSASTMSSGFGSSTFGSPSQSSQSSNAITFGSGGGGFGAVSNTNQQQSSSSQPQQQTQTNLFAFGSAAKQQQQQGSQTGVPTQTPSLFGNVSSTTNKGFSFGSPSTGLAAATVAPSVSSSAFVFGSSAQKSNEITPTFGSTAAAAGSSGNAGSAVAPIPNFGSTFAAPSSINPQQQQQQATSAFGQPTVAAPPNPFGGSSTNNVPVFGSASTSVTNPPTLFGSSAGFGNNSTFGSTAAQPVFGSAATAAAAPPAFGSTPFGSIAPAGQSHADGPVAKKPAGAFEFGASQPTPMANFSFGANNNNNNNNNNTNKTPFAFSANATPSFNFSGSGETAPNAPFQFNAGAAATNNPFAPGIGTPTSTTQRRKLRPATRRTQQR